MDSLTYAAIMCHVGTELRDRMNQATASNLGRDFVFACEHALEHRTAEFGFSDSREAVR